jgi:hypothetical protein
VLGRLAKGESGVAMGLAVIMVMLIGVMGAGLLVFVRSDLEAVVEVNQGHRALNLADAGVQAARRQLRSDAEPEHYDGDSAENVRWAYVAPVGGATGETLNLDDGSVRATIQYLLPSTTAAQVGDGNHAPELVPGDPPGLTDYPNGRDFFKVISEGTAGGARRKVEAILYTSKLDVPAAHYTPKDITLEGDMSVGGVSLFAGGNIDKVGNVTIDRETPAIYGDWDTTSSSPPSRLNTVPRTDASGTRTTGAGLAAEGLICENGDCADSPANSVADGVHDYDRYTGTKGSNKLFVRKADPDVPNAPGTISYPFDPGASLDLNFLMEEARRQGNYRSSAADITDFPTVSNDQTVYFVDAGGAANFLEYRVDPASETRGTIVVRDGNLAVGGSSGRFRGVIVVTGDGADTGKYAGGNVDGFVVASGDMTIRDSASPSTIAESLTTRPGFYSVRLWSWRELYE